MAPRMDIKKLEKYFHFINGRAVCKICSHKLKGDRNFNLKTHLKRVHQISTKDFVKRESHESDRSSVLKETFKKRIIKIEVCKKQLIRSYIGLVTEDGIPFNILNSENLKNIMDPISHALSEKYDKQFRFNCTNTEQALKLVSEHIRDSIKIEVNQRLLSLIVDSGTRLPQNTFIISLQFIKSDEIQSRMLGLVELKGADASSAIDLSAGILRTLNKYDINMSQIVSITSDNGADMINASKILSHCSIFEDGNKMHDADDSNDMDLKNIQMFEDTSEEQLGDIQICRCVGHTAHLCAVEVTDDDEIEMFLLSCRNLVKFIKNQSNIYEDIFEQKGLKIPNLDCPTKWGSTYNMALAVKSAKEILVKIEPIDNKSIDGNFALHNNFWEFIDAYCVSFNSLQRTIEKLQAEQLHYGDFYAIWLKCKICTEKVLQENNEPFVEKIAKKLLHSMEIRKAELFSNESLVSCLYLDPRFHHTLTHAQKRKAAAYLKRLYDRMKAVNMQTEENHTELPSSSSEIGQFADEADEYLNKYLIQNFAQKADKYIDVHSKIVNLKLPFLRADCNVLQFWKEKQYTEPELYALSNICFAVPPTQMIIESGFSSLKHILADDRNQLNHDTLENLLLVKVNSAFLDKAIEDLPLFED